MASRKPPPKRSKASVRTRTPTGSPPPRSSTPRSSVPPKANRGSQARLGRWVMRLFLVAVLSLVVAPVGLVALYSLVPPPITPLMIERVVEGKGLDRRWRPIDRISPALVQSVIAAEDAGFCAHHGFDFKAMQAAQAHNARHPGKLRGGSTISQQTAKNVFLWPQRSYVRKALEAYFTELIELFWGKRRILEVYLNVVEWGPGVYGAEAASARYFGHDVDDLTSDEAARLAAILPDPLKWKAVHPGRYVLHRSRKIGAAAITVRADDLAACVRR